MNTEKKNRYFVSGLLLTVAVLASINLINCGGSSSAPVIYSISPGSTVATTSGIPASTSLTLIGANFGSTQVTGTSVLYINNAVITPAAWSDSSIVTSIPTYSATSLTIGSSYTVPVAVVVGGTVSNAVSFVYNITGP
ncbi:MAG: hypothetical protein HYR80_09515 [Nitrospirae bacterium]|nr:hypothetical protein [Nitrospirota bacterium]